MNKDTRQLKRAYRRARKLDADVISFKHWLQEWNWLQYIGWKARKMMSKGRYKSFAQTGATK